MYLLGLTPPPLSHAFPFYSHSRRGGGYCGGIIAIFLRTGAGWEQTLSMGFGWDVRNVGSYDDKLDGMKGVHNPAPLTAGVTDGQWW